MELEKDMTPILLEDLGMRFATEKSKRKSRYGLYKCQYCGKEFEVYIYHVGSGNTKSCGCLLSTHGQRKHPLYNTWAGMKSRCYNLKDKYYKDYGGRGIKVCDRWLDIHNFIEDMLSSYQEGLSIDRIDVNGNYEPDNCRWTTTTIQARNTRDIYKHNKSGFRGVSWNKRDKKWVSQISIDNKKVSIGYYSTSIDAAKAYERFVRLNNLEHNFTPVLSEEEIEELNNEKGKIDDTDISYLRRA